MTSIKNHTASDLESKAAVFAEKKHKSQLDDEGRNYFQTHIKQVVDILAQITDDEEILAAAWLHDTLEDTQTTKEELAKEFTPRVAELVHEVTHEGKKDENGYYFPRLHSKDAILLKFADRLSNLSRMSAWPLERQEHYLQKSKFWKNEVLKK